MFEWLTELGSERPYAWHVLVGCWLGCGWLARLHAVSCWSPNWSDRSDWSDWFLLIRATIGNTESLESIHKGNFPSHKYA